MGGASSMQRTRLAGQMKEKKAMLPLFVGMFYTSKNGTKSIFYDLHNPLSIDYIRGKPFLPGASTSIPSNTFSKQTLNVDTISTWLILTSIH
ncbi:hypothetical protein ACJX0J_013648, partial [Zea mays]